MEPETSNQNSPSPEKVEKLKMFAQSPELAMFDMLDEINSKLETFADVFKDVDFSKVNELKGDKPEKGVDYLTEEELEEIRDMIAEQATPVKGVHYFDGEDADVESIKAELREYVDGLMGNGIKSMDQEATDPIINQ